MPSAGLIARIAGGASTIRWLAYLDFNGDTLRATTGLYDRTFASTGDSDVDGFTFQSLPAELVSIGDVQHRDDGSETVAVSLTGLVSVNSDVLTTIATVSNWQTRVARLWWYDEDSATGGPWNNEVVGYYTGRMSSITIAGAPGGDDGPGSQTVAVEIEGYLASFKQASGRKYLSLSDSSGALSVAVANGTSAVGSAFAGVNPGIYGGVGLSIPSVSFR